MEKLKSLKDKTKNLNLNLEHPNTWLGFGCAIIVLVLVGRFAIGFGSPSAEVITDQPTSNLYIIQTMPLVPPNATTPSPTPQTTPSPTPEPVTPTPTPTERWCNATGCYDGPIPTPTPEPTPTQTPTPTPVPIDAPIWMQLGFKCEIKDIVAILPWAQQYKWYCACEIKDKYKLGDYYSVIEACNSPVSTGWKKDSCDCMELICKESRLC